MKRYLLIVCAVAAFFTALFLAVGALGVPILSDPAPWMSRGGVFAASVGVGLLVADVLLPVPSSLVMVAHGALFGVLTGTLLSLAGSLGAGLFGFWLGRRGGRLLGRVMTRAERERADGLLRRWGALAIVLTRPVPILAETVAIMAGASPMGWPRVALAVLAGSLPPALVYALAGAAAASFRSTALVFVFVILAAGFFWMTSRLLDPFLGGREAHGVADSFPNLGPQRKESSHGD
ncbi:MAG TPA: VTT domain-containing protein [Pyrinomonadaceae bacterium]|nr:VTT domain-containing protein [Pyrinomonadaceae bacterium]